ncbi:MAG: PEGA domain-containing protein [Deltaproteobacteria bacterium]|nr:PEGA domain-containing protein [Deltaproteobacteria bacterium]
MRYILLSIVATWSLSPDAAARARYRIRVESVPQGAAVYLESKVGGVQGYTPHQFKLEPGMYTLILEKAGFAPLKRDIEVQRRAATHSFTLERIATPAELAVDSAPDKRAEGAEVTVNGKAVGKLPLRLTLRPGRYLLEVNKAGFARYTAWVDVREGEKRAIAVGLVAEAPASQTMLLVACDVPDAELFVDDKAVDKGVALVPVTPGKHRVEARIGGKPAQLREVVAVADQTTKVTFYLRQTASAATLQIVASEKDTEVFVNGEPRGKAPIRIDGLPPGTHLVEGKKNGFARAEQSVQLIAGEFKAIKLTLSKQQPRGGSVRVVSPLLGAQVFLDGRFVGKTPLLRHGVDPGPHFVTVRHPKHKELVKSIEVKQGETVAVEAKLDPLEGKPAPKKPHNPLIGMFSHAAEPVRAGYFTGDFSLGFVDLLQARLSAGIFSSSILALDAGILLGTYGTVTQIGMHAKFRLFRHEMFSVALTYALGGGGGPSSRNTFYTDFGGQASVTLKDRVAFTARSYFNFYTDRLCPTSGNQAQAGGCSNRPSGITAQEVRERFAGLRFFLAAIVEVTLTQRLNLFAILEGTPIGERRAFTDAFAGYMPKNDPNVYGRIGLTLKY